MRLFIITCIFIFFPTFVFAAGMTKQDACSYPEGIHKEEVYVLWPGKIPYIEEFLKKDGFLYYFIHTFPDRESLIAYQDADGRGDYIPNTGSYFVSFDCNRSKVKFIPQIRSLSHNAYGKLNWIQGTYISYSLIADNRDPCITGPDTIMNISNLKQLRIDRTPGIPRSTKKICVGRSVYKPIENGILQFDIEQHTWETKESFYSRYHYYLSTGKLKKIR